MGQASGHRKELSLGDRPRLQLTSPGGWVSRVYYAQNIVGGADTVTVTLSGSSSSIELYLSEYSGIDPTNPIDAQAGASGNGGAVSSGNATTTATGDVIYGFCIGDGTCTAGWGFTARSTLDGNLIEDMLAGNAGSYAATGSANYGWNMQMVALKPASPAPPLIISPLTASGSVGTPFSYQIAATEGPTSYSATGLPAGLSVNGATGFISGAPASAGTATVAITATNTSGTGGATLTLTITAAAAASFVQAAAVAAQGGANSVTLPFPANTLAGDLLLVAFDYGSSVTVSSVSDSLGNAFTPVGSPLTSPGGRTSQVYYAQNVLVGADTVMVTLSGTTSSLQLYLSEYSGIDPNNPIDAQAGASGAAGAVSSGTAATSVAGDMIYGFCVADSNCTAGSGFTARSTLDGNLIEDRVAGNAGSYAATGTANQGWTMQMVALKPASPPGGGGQTTSSTSLTSSLNPSTYGTLVTFTATVTPSTATGTVTFYSDGASIGAGGLSGGTATLGTSTLATGSHSITASYGGDSNDAASTSSPLTQTVQATTPAPAITSFTPSSASFGTPVSVTGANLAGSGVTPVVTLSAAGGGTTNAPVTSASATNLSFIVPTGAATGPITVTVNGQSCSSSTPLTIVAASSFTLTAAPSSVTLLPGQSTTVSVSLSSTNGFSQLAMLGVSGLPSGITANFQPQSITAGGSSLLTLTSSAGVSPAVVPLTISAGATVQGIAESQSATVTLTVEGAGSVAFQGRVAVTNPSLNIPLVGVTVRFLGVNYTGASTGCNAWTQTDSAGNFIFASLPSACAGSQMVQYDPTTVSSPPGAFSGVNLSYVLTPGQVTTPGLVIHLPNVATVETVQVQQNSSTDQTFVFHSIPGVVITVYARTTLSLSDSTQPNPFPVSVVEIPYEQVPDYMPPSPTQDPVFAMSIEPYNSSASQPVAVTFPNRSNKPPGSSMPLTSLNPTLGMMVPYGTGTVSADGTEVVPNLDPNNPGHLYGISHFDWHLPQPTAQNATNPSPDKHSPKCGEPVDLSSGLQVLTKTDMAFGGARGQVGITRTFRGLSGNPGPFGIGTNHNYGYMLDTTSISTGLINLIVPDGNQFPFVQQTNGAFVNSTVPSLAGAVLTQGTCVTTEYGSGCGGTLRWKDGTVYQFQSLLEGSPGIAFLMSISDSNGNTTALTHSGTVPSEITQITDPVGRSLNLTYDGSYQILSVSDPLGRTVQYQYNSQGMLATVTDAKGGVTTYGYDSNNNLTSITDPRGITFLQDTYDQNGRVIKQVAADGGVTTFAYTQLNPTIATSPVAYTVVTAPLGNQATYHFNPAGFLLDMTDASGQKTVYTRDPASNQLLSVTDPLGRTTAYTYDANGNTTSITLLAGTPGSVTTSYTYDPTFNKVTSVTDPLGHTSSMKYDASGNLVAVTDPLGNQASLAYDNYGELTSASDPLGNSAQLAYTNGDLVGVTDPMGRTSTRVTDSVSRLITTINPLGQTRQYQYDPVDELTQVVDPQGNPTHLAYDGDGNLTSQTDALGHATTYTYDQMNRLASRTDPLGHSESHQYDQNGNLTQSTDRRGVATSYSYDVLNRLVQAGFGGQSSIGFTYDTVGRLTQAADSITGTISHSYDALDRLTAETTPQGSISYTYDNAGRRTAMSVAGQNPISYSYDSDNRLTQITQGASNVVLAHDNDSRRTSLTLPNGVTATYGYDADSELSAINYQLGSTLLGNLTYTYDLAGRRTSVGGSFAKTGTPSAVASASYNADNQLAQFGSASLSSDANGNVTSDGTHTYTWDARDQLVSIGGAVSASFQYDPFGRRVTKTVGTATTNFLYDGMNPIEELSGSAATANLLTGLRLHEYFQRTDSNGPASFLTDALGSTIALTGATGTTLAQYTYDPYGNMTMTGSSLNPYQFTGHENDGIGLYHYGRRYYDPLYARFLNEGSSARVSRGVNFFDYFGSDPVNPAGAPDAMDPDPSATGISTGTSCDGGKLRLRVHSDCRTTTDTIYYELEGSDDADTWYVTEHQSQGWLAGPGGVSTWKDPGGFKDLITGNGAIDSKQSFTISKPGCPSYSVNVELPSGPKGTKDEWQQYGTLGIWKAAGWNSPSFVNGNSTGWVPCLPEYAQ
jgi:RHS repeat-associated protein